jgi:hypothetical protein
MLLRLDGLFRLMLCTSGTDTHAELRRPMRHIGRGEACVSMDCVCGQAPVYLCLYPVNTRPNLRH